MDDQTKVESILYRNSIMNVEEISKNVARDIFKCGDESNSPANRIEFMGGSWAEGTEVPQGGFCESSLAVFIAETLRKHIDA